MTKKEKIVPVKPFKRVFFDLETSFNIVSSWRIGRKINISAENIIKERAIICVCWKIEGEKTIHSLSWNKGDDKKLVTDFVKILNDCDEAIAHNGDSFDLKWFRTRCIYHGIPMIPDVKTIDTLKLSRKGFNFNSNRLDYIGRFLGVGHKVETGGFQLWVDIVMHNNQKSLDKMINYCKGDITLLEAVYKKLSPYILSASHKGVHCGKGIHTCPECTSDKVISNGTRLTASGVVKRRLNCTKCGKYFSISEKDYKPKK